MSIIVLNKVVEPRTILFCFHHSGGNANYFRMWSKRMADAGVELCGLNLPSRQISERSQVHNDTQTVHELCKDILCVAITNHLERMHVSRDTAPKPRICFFGHSLGALMAFEVARQLEKTSSFRDDCNEPATFQLQLILSAANSPVDLHYFNTSPLSNLIHRLSNDDLLEHIKRIGGLPTGVHPDIVAAMLPVVRRDYQYFETYSLPHQYQDAITERLTCPDPTSTIDLGIARESSRPHCRFERVAITNVACQCFQEYALNCPVITMGSCLDPSVGETQLLRWHDFTVHSSRHHIRFHEGTHFYLGELPVKECVQDEIVRICIE